MPRLAVDVAEHAHQQVLHQLELRDRQAELFPLLRIVQRDLVGRDHHAHRLPGHAAAGTAQDHGGIAEGVRVLQPAGLWHPAVLDQNVGVLHRAQRDLVFDLGRGKTRSALFHHEALDVVVLFVARPHHDVVSKRAVADPALGAVENPFIALTARGGLQARGDVGPAVRFSERERADLLHAPHRGQPAFLLLRRAAGEDAAHGQPGVNTQEGRHRRVGMSHLQGQEPRQQTARLRPGLLGVGAPGDAQLRIASDELGGELGAGPVVVGDGGDLGAQELADPVQGLAFLAGQQFLEVVEVAGQQLAREKSFPSLRRLQVSRVASSA